MMPFKGDSTFRGRVWDRAEGAENVDFNLFFNDLLCSKDNTFKLLLIDDNICSSRVAL